MCTHAACTNQEWARWGMCQGPVASGCRLRSHFALFPHSTSCYFLPLYRQGWTSAHLLQCLFLSPCRVTQITQPVKPWLSSFQSSVRLQGFCLEGSGGTPQVEDTQGRGTVSCPKDRQEGGFCYMPCGGRIRGVQLGRTWAFQAGRTQPASPLSHSHSLDSASPAWGHLLWAAG